MNSFTELQHCTYISCFFTSVFQVPFIQLFHLSLLYSSPNVIVEKSPCTHLLTVEPVNDPVHFRTMYRHYYYYHPGIVYKMRIRKKKKKNDQTCCYFLPLFYMWNIFTKITQRRWALGRSVRFWENIIVSWGHFSPWCAWESSSLTRKWKKKTSTNMCTQ